MRLIIWFAFLLSSHAFAADLRGLERIFQSNFDRFYVPARCGENVLNLITEAQKQKVDLSNAYVLKIVGAGFLETSGFYARGAAQDRKMLGYFHFVLVADGYVFDFDLDEPLMLKLEDYVRLQFTPPYRPFRIYGVDFDPLKELPWWTVSRYEWRTYLHSIDNKTWTKKMGEFIDLNQMLKRERVR